MAILRPPLDALVPRLVERRELPAASALYGAVRNASALGGPALAGVLIATVGFAVDLRPRRALLPRSRSPRCGGCARRRPPPDAEPPSWRGIVEGVRFARSKPELIGTYLIDINAMFFAMPEALFPAYAQRHGGAAVAGLLYAAPAAGALVLSLASGWTRHVVRHGRAVVLAAAGWGAAIVVFGLAGPLWLGIAALAVAGASDAVSAIFRATIWNETVPDRMRGRLAGMEMISYTSGPTARQRRGRLRRRADRPARLDRRRRRALRRGLVRARGRPAGAVALRVRGDEAAGVGERQRRLGRGREFRPRRIERWITRPQTEQSTARVRSGRADGSLTPLPSRSSAPCRALVLLAEPAHAPHAPTAAGTTSATIASTNSTTANGRSRNAPKSPSETSSVRRNCASISGPEDHAEDHRRDREVEAAHEEPEHADRRT